MNLNSINWPLQKKAAVNLYLHYLIQVVKQLDITFSDEYPNPVELASQFIANEIDENTYRSQANIWWKFLDETQNLREFEKSEVLYARIAICLLSATTEEAEELAEHLSWFLEVLGGLGIDMKVPLEALSKHFEFE